MKHLMKSITLCSVLIAALLLTAACSTDNGDLLATIPAKRDYVAVVNLNLTARKLNIRIDDNTVQFPPALARQLQRIGDDELTTVSKIFKAVDMDHVVLFGMRDDDPIITFRIADASLLSELTGDFDTTTSSDFRVTRIGGGLSLAVKDTQGWLLRSSDPADELKKLLDEARADNIAAKSGINDALEADAPARLAISIDPDLWACAGIDITGRTIESKVRLIHPDSGIAVPIPGLQPLSSDFLKYIPATANFAAAIGATSDTDWSTISSALEMLHDPQLRGMLDTVIPYFEKADGTIALAASIDATDISNSGTSFLLMAHMPAPEIEAALTDVKNRITAAGLTPRIDPHGAIYISGGGTALYAAGIDGNLAISSQPLTPTHAGNLDAYFTDCRAAAVLKLPHIPFIGQSTGITLSIRVMQEHTTLTLATDKNIEELIATMLAFAI